MKKLILSIILISISLSNCFAENSLKILAVGDVLLAQKYTKRIIKRNGYDYLFKNVADYIKDADISICNLEFVLSEKGEPHNKKWTFRTEPKYIQAFINAGFDIVDLGNNHTLDYGRKAFLETLDVVQNAGLKVIGAGRTLQEILKGVVIEKNGIRVGVIGFACIKPVSFYAGKERSGVIPCERKLISKGVRQLKQESDIVVAVFHWGKEYRYYIVDYQKELSRLAIDNGAGVVIGHHPHVLQGIDTYKGKPILYSIGNFVFAPGKIKGRDTCFSEIEIKKSENGEVLASKVYITPVYLYGSQPKIATGQKAYEILNLVKNLSEDFGTKVVIDEDNNRAEVVDFSSEDTLTMPRDIADYNVVIDKTHLTLKIINSSGTAERTYTISTGENLGDKQKVGDLRTPEGDFHITQIVDSSKWEYDFNDGKGPIAGAYGPWFFRLKTEWQGIGIHGTHNDLLIGKHNSHGCIRMRNKDLIDFKRYVKLGAKVKIKP